MRNRTVSVVITCRNYGQFLDRCLSSVKAQTYQNLEVIVVDDASTDSTQAVCSSYKIDHYHRNDEQQGLAKSANIGMYRASGEYVMRLDADDWLDPSGIAVMVGHLELRPEVAAVFSDYWRFQVELKRVYTEQEEARVPYGSCMLMARSAFNTLGGYNEKLKFQEDYDFYLRLEDQYLVEKLNLALWYYRQHPGQMSSAHNAKMKVRQSLTKGLKILTVIPARGGSKEIPGKNLKELAGLSLVARAIRMVKKSRIDTVVVVSTDSPEIAKVAESEGVCWLDRPQELAEDNVSTIPVAKHAMEYMDGEDWRPDIVVTVQPTCPYTPPEALSKAISRMFTSEFDCVVSCASFSGKHPYRAYRWVGDRNLVPMFPGLAEKYLQRQDRPEAFEFTGGFYVRRRELLENWNGKDFAIGQVSGVEVLPWQAVDIDGKLDLWLAESIMQHQQENDNA